MKPIQLLTLAAVLSQGTFACLEHLLQERTPDPNDMIRRQEPAPRSKTAIKNVRVFDGTKLTGLQTVIIDGENISNDTSNIETTVDGNGGVLIPGLIDCHVHISNVAGLETLTSYGVTTAMVMACRNYTQCAPLRNLEGVASFVSAGVPATGPGSQHSRTFNLSSQYLIYPTDNATEVVSYTFGNGSDFYKITAELNGPSQSMQDSLVDAVHNLGKQSMTHAADLDAWTQAVLSGTDGIQHIPTNGRINASNVLKARRSTNSWSTPTMNIARYAFANPAILTFTGHQIGGPDSYDNVYQNVRAIHAAGIPILAGTDAVGVINANISVPFGLSLHFELENLVEAGLTTVEALRAATELAAQHHRLADRGKIAPGMRADLILLNSDPLANITNTRDIAKVWVGGIEYKDVANSTGLSNPPANYTKAGTSSGSGSGSGSGSSGSGSGTGNGAGKAIVLSWTSLLGLQVGVMLYFFM
ncbi:Amidohydro-rel domain-containing protein [Trichoderma simmonsii]|uniref:Amidohydro-rel domain-containing protein n=1 Tax=Trichoderma simmonsii TaxID=1491479 RepID=A0A8G0PK03_9HYPO|nr:Amidohydro-rel domain-containing protein [Trichoderma simmonsii]